MLRESNITKLSNVPRILLLLVAIVGLNGLLVGGSIIQRHAFARSSLQQSDQDEIEDQQNAELDHTKQENAQKENATRKNIEKTDSSHSRSPAQLTDPQNLGALEAPELSIATSGSVPDDDPLLNEIRKHAEAQFPEVFDSRNHSLLRASTSDVNGSQSPLVADFQPTTSSLHTRLEAIGKLNEATLLLVQLAAQQRDLGYNDQAELMLARARQLRNLMIEPLGE